MNWAWSAEGFEWELFETEEEPNGSSVFATWTEAKAALASDLRDSAWAYQQAARAVNASIKGDVCDGHLRGSY